MFLKDFEGTVPLFFVYLLVVLLYQPQREGLVGTASVRWAQGPSSTRGHVDAWGVQLPAPLACSQALHVPPGVGGKVPHEHILLGSWNLPGLENYPPFLPSPCFHLQKKKKIRKKPCLEQTGGKATVLLLLEMPTGAGSWAVRVPC